MNQTTTSRLAASESFFLQLGNDLIDGFPQIANENATISKSCRLDEQSHSSNTTLHTKPVYTKM